MQIDITGYICLAWDNGYSADIGLPRPGYMYETKIGPVYGGSSYLGYHTYYEIVWDPIKCEIHGPSHANIGLPMDCGLYRWVIGVTPPNTYDPPYVHFKWATFIFTFKVVGNRL